MKRLIIIALVLISTVKPGFTQPRASVKASAQLCANALLKGDYPTLLKYTYPKLIEAMGGKEQMINTLKQKLKDMSDRGISISKVEIGEPGKKYQAGTEIHCLIPEKLTLKITGGAIVTSSNLLAVSVDKEKSWYFLDTSSIPANQDFKKLFPNFNNNLVIPPPSQPVFVKDPVK